MAKTHRHAMRPQALITKETVPIVSWFINFVGIMLIGIPVRYVFHVLGIDGEQEFHVYSWSFTLITLFTSLYLTKKDCGK